MLQTLKEHTQTFLQLLNWEGRLDSKLSELYQTFLKLTLLTLLILETGTPHSFYRLKEGYVQRLARKLWRELKHTTVLL